MGTQGGNKREVGDYRDNRVEVQEEKSVERGNTVSKENRLKRRADWLFS